ncbi:TPA: SoxR reducing system RseC family protein [Vibrio cholerae]|uniref:SoxR reducing system RseC family protein n=1 Tax=Vibrio cholerae TaxID=666 RepID=UPI000F0B2227|nr:SoxR reducing system RseC family protein [Vibrio cholerae]EHD2269380.1 transcriptional regulator [Vibrio cholerae]EIC2298283.1 SoxR reducing system RseC family protein [Vibrio cholerae]EIF8949316.1 SoxR reducing system RseC family protein [Vibrio cholerae]EIJ2218651.1 SoxR reducing system RseC family protein [Vibrio cholerae]EJL6693818.1 SoxR reducing system RseC family protein [Vibrio cholerae]
MMTALATVTKVVPAQQGFQVTLSCEQQTSCSSCQSSKSCGTGIVSKAFGNKTLFWRLQTTQALEAGEVVEIGLPEKSVLQSAALVYLLPLFFMMLGAWLGDQWLAPMLGFGEGMVILTALLFIALGVWVAKHYAKVLELRSQQQVVLLRKLGIPVA